MFLQKFLENVEHCSVFEVSLEFSTGDSPGIISSLFSLTGGQLPIVAEGGARSGAEAWDQVVAGASLVQVSAGLVQHGPPLLTRIRTDLRDLMLEAGYDNIQQAVGAGAHCRGE